MTASFFSARSDVLITALVNLLSSLNRNRASPREKNECVADLVYGERRADMVMCDRMLGHRGVFSLRRLLYQAQPACRGDVQKTLHSVMAATGQDDRDDPRAIGTCRR